MVGLLLFSTTHGYGKLIETITLIGMEGTDVILSDGSSLPCSIRLKNTIKELLRGK